MAATFLEIFLLILGAAGISNAFLPSDNFEWNTRVVPQRYDHYEKSRIAQQIAERCFKIYGSSACRNAFAYNPSDFQVERLYRRKYSNPFLRADVNIPLGVSTMTNEKMTTDSLYHSSKNGISSNLQDNTIEAKTMNRHNLLNYILTESPDKSASPTYPNAIFKSRPFSTSLSADENIPSDSKEIQKNSLISIISSEPNNVRQARQETTSNSDISHAVSRTSIKPEYKSSSEKENLEFKLGQSTFSTEASEKDTIITATVNDESEITSEFLKDDSVNSYSTVLEIKGTSSDILFPTKTSSSQEILSTDEENVEDEATIFQATTSVLTEDTTNLNDKSNTPFGIQSTNNEDTELVSATSHNPIPTADETVSLNVKSSSSDRIYSTTTRNLDTESITPQSSASDDTALQSKFSTSSEIIPTTIEILHSESTKENVILSSKVPLLPLTDEVTQDNIKEISSTKSSENESTPQVIPEDHIIKISSIRTARIVITSVFLVIALTAVTLLAVYIFRINRKEVQYDQLLLIS